jgi:hypothetical protein
MTKPTTIALSELRFDESIYPRQNIDEHNIKQMIHAIEGGITMPPIVVERGRKRIVDGVHRFQVSLRRGEKKIAVAWKAYANDAELVRDAILLNSGVGLRLGIDDTLKCIEIAKRVGLKELELAGALRTSISHLRAISPRYATVEDAKAGVTEGRRIALKGSVRHLSGQKLTEAQAAAMPGAPGQSFLLTTRQLASALEHDLLPPQERHPVLWEELERLHNLLGRKLGVKKAA